MVKKIGHPAATSLPSAKSVVFTNGRDAASRRHVGTSNVSKNPIAFGVTP
jgi:hypothetical protein